MELAVMGSGQSLSVSDAVFARDFNEHLVHQVVVAFRNAGRACSDVSECIANGWRKSLRSGFEAPVSLSKSEKYHFVGVELHPTFPRPVITGAKHPFHPVRAEVSDSPSGSTTEYHRSYQLTHELIDRVLVECQEQK